MVFGRQVLIVQQFLQCTVPPDLGEPNACSTAVVQFLTSPHFSHHRAVGRGMMLAWRVPSWTMAPEALVRFAFCLVSVGLSVMPRCRRVAATRVRRGGACLGGLGQAACGKGPFLCGRTGRRDGDFDAAYGDTHHARRRRAHRPSKPIIAATGWRAWWRPRCGRHRDRAGIP